MSITLVICTYNRCDSLKQTLGDLSKISHEFTDKDSVLVINNRSTDSTSHFLESIKRVAPYNNQLKLRYVYEVTPGLAAARNRAIAETHTDHLIFIDDDVSVTCGFLNAYRRSFEQHPQHGFFGGKIHVKWPKNVNNKQVKPSWLEREDMPLISGLIGYYDQGNQNLSYTNNPNMLHPYGANFAISRKLTLSVGLFNTELGVKGISLGRGEESEYFKRAIETGFEGIYVAGSKTFHRLLTDPFTTSYLFKYGIQKGVAAMKINGTATQNNSLLNLSQYIIKGLFQLLIKRRKDRYYQCIINCGIQFANYRFSRQPGFQGKQPSAY